MSVMKKVKMEVAPPAGWSNGEMKGEGKMAFYDWNHDGENDYKDEFIEYQNFNESDKDSNYIPRRGGGISTLGAIVATVGGLFLASFIVVLFGGGEDTPVLLTIIVWILCGTGLSMWFDKVGF